MKDEIIILKDPSGEDEPVVVEKGLGFNPIAGDRFKGNGTIYKLAGVWWKAGKRVRVELVDQATNKTQEGGWDGFEKMLKEGVLEWV